jgi:hypothetical protein
MGIGVVGDRELSQEEKVMEKGNQCTERHGAQPGDNSDYSCGEPQSQRPQGNLAPHSRHKPIEPRTDVSFGPPHG